MDEKKINYAKLGRLLFYGNWAAQKFHDHHCPYFPCKYNDNPVHAVSNIIMKQKDLDISKIPVKFVRLWWLSKIKGYRHLIISEEQVPIFSVNYIDKDQAWDLYRNHWIYVRDKIGTMSMREYKRGKPKPVNVSGKAGSHTLHMAGFTKLKYKRPNGRF